ncbi:UNVERIFIED_CONTAM: hypothetical protein FKN15_032520 [Acipenser sinensis]
MSQWLRWDLNQGLPSYKPISLTTGPVLLELSYGKKQILWRLTVQRLFYDRQ